MNDVTSGRPTTLYRLFAADGSLLYVGIAGNPGRRFEQHAGDKPWWGQVARTELEHLPTREAALEAERQAIKAERPAHNVTHNDGASGQPPLALDALPQRNADSDPLVGQWFHSLTAEGYVHWQGEVLGRVQPGLYLVATFSWLDGDRYSNHLVPIEAMAGWIFYDDHEWMNYSYEYGAAFGKRREKP